MTFVLISKGHYAYAQQNGLIATPNDSLLLGKEAPITIGTIEITGNKKTKSFIILREIPFKEGDQYSMDVLVKKLEDAKRQLLNTTLFLNVVVSVKEFRGHVADISILLKERWYLFPVPYFKPVDRNLNQWIVEQNASLKRIEFGAKLYYYNASGRNDRLRALAITGYTRQLSLSYDRLYFDKKMQWGFRGELSAGKNHEINYATKNNKQQFWRDEDRFVRSSVKARAELTYRKAIKTRHSFGVGYVNETIIDSILYLNPYYFKSGRRKTVYPELYYNLTYFDVDYIPYPTKGYAADILFSKKGFNNIVNLWQLSAKAQGSWHLSPRTFFNLNVFGTIKLPFRQPYFQQRLLGYNDMFMQGYEYYVVDGAAGGYAKATLSRELIKFSLRVPPVKKGTVATRIPFRIFGKIYGNTGYIYHPEPGENFLNNKMLYSGGIGIDILCIYDVTFKLEWSFNQLGQNGIFIHRKNLY